MIDKPLHAPQLSSAVSGVAGGRGNQALYQLFETSKGENAINRRN